MYIPIHSLLSPPLGAPAELCRGGGEAPDALAKALLSKEDFNTMLLLFCLGGGWSAQSYLTEGDETRSTPFVAAPS